MDGILVLWKEKGMTSHDCVYKLRKILQTKKIGHGGTLDPDVEGVLPICIGRATKVSEYLINSGKTYEGEITLGFSTTTEDASGEVVASVLINRPLEIKKIDEAMASFLGTIEQTPPMYSAVKVNGKKLCEYARNNEEVKRAKRRVQIDSFERLISPNFNEKTGTISWSFRVECGKGTYIRTLAVDLGEKLGFPAHLSKLTRTKAAGFNYYEAHTLKEIAQINNAGALSEILFPIEIGATDFPHIDLSPELYEKVRNGARLTFDELGIVEKLPTLYALFYHGKLASLYMNHPELKKTLKPRKVFV